MAYSEDLADRVRVLPSGRDDESEWIELARRSSPRRARSGPPTCSFARCCPLIRRRFHRAQRAILSGLQEAATRAVAA